MAKSVPELLREAAQAPEWQTTNVHRDRSLHQWNDRVPPGSHAVEGSEDRGDGRVASGRERGHPRLRQLLMHLRKERHLRRARL